MSEIESSPPIDPQPIPNQVVNQQQEIEVNKVVDALRAERDLDFQKELQKQRGLELLEDRVDVELAQVKSDGLSTILTWSAVGIGAGLLLGIFSGD